MARQTDDNEFKTFLRGYWEFPRTKPNLYYSFLRGAILSAIVSIFFPDDTVVELVVWAIAVGLAFMAIDNVAWKYYSKKKGEQ